MLVTEEQWPFPLELLLVVELPLIFLRPSSRMSRLGNARLAWFDVDHGIGFSRGRTYCVCYVDQSHVDSSGSRALPSHICPRTLVVSLA